jgi:ubiquinone/menaquinone biosynthesis C-methylase UbiE
VRQPDDSKYVPALGFRWLTPYYDTVVRVTTRERTFKQALIRQANIEPGQHVLDLACGTGTLSIWIKAAYPQTDVVGVDGDSAVLSLAARKAEQAVVSVQFDEAMSYDLPYSGAHFDRVVSSLFFHHLSWEDKGRTVQEIYRILRPGAQLHVADWGKATNIVTRGLFVSIQLLDGFKNTQDNVTGKLIELFEHAGFVEVSQRQTFSTIFGTMALYSADKLG